MGENTLGGGRNLRRMTMEDPVALTAQLAAIDSINPGLMLGAAGEGEVADFVEAWGRARGFEVHRQEAAPSRPNVVLVRRGSGGGKSLLFNGHMDTVGVHGARTKDVFVADGKLYGRGVLDTKAGLAAAMVVVASFAPGELCGDLIVAGVADEESGSIGTSKLVEDWRPDAAVALEPTDLVVISRHRGFAVIDVDLTGKPAHTSRAERGINAVHAVADVIRAVTALNDRWAAAEPDPLERATVLVNQVHSGGELFTVPPTCNVTVEMRTTGRKAGQQIEEVLATISASTPLVTKCEVQFARNPLAQPDDHPFVQAMLRAVQTAGIEPRLSAAPFWTDAAYHAEVGTAACVVGPVGQGLHEDEEWVTVESVHQCAAALRALAVDWCELTPAVTSVGE